MNNKEPHYWLNEMNRYLVLSLKDTNDYTREQIENAIDCLQKHQEVFVLLQHELLKKKGA